MREYFSQFGTVKHVRLSRSKKTGKSKHYAFLQFESPEVAKIAAETMNNYLLFGHILKCHVIPSDQVHEKLWVGADKRFKTVPWSKIEGRKLDLAKGRSEWDKKVKKATKSREEKQQKLKEIGYDFEVPQLKGVDQVPVKEGQSALEPDVKSAEDEAPAQITETTVVPNLDGGVADIPVEVKQTITTASGDDGVVVTEEVTREKKREERKNKKRGNTTLDHPDKAAKAMKRTKLSTSMTES